VTNVNYTDRGDFRMSIETTQRQGLSESQVAQFNRDGFLFPISVLTDDEVRRYLSSCRDLYQHLKRHLGRPAGHVQQAHLHFKWAYDLATNAKLLDIVESLVGPDILIAHSVIFFKERHSQQRIAWHYDAGPAAALKIDRPSECVAAWVALTDSNLDNGCVQMIPESHLHPDQTIENVGAGYVTRGDNQNAAASRTDAAPVILNPGSMSLHHVNVVHGSDENRSARDRIGMSFLYSSTRTHLSLEYIKVLLARGKDAYGYYQLLDQPPGNSIERSIQEQRDYWRRQRVLWKVKSGPNQIMEFYD
jgi:non-haem Fe2+, alpha-ketoglutarate-dependent halogenase